MSIHYGCYHHAFNTKSNRRILTTLVKWTNSYTSISHRTFPGIPLSKGQACHKFRSCNYFQRSCDPFYRQNPSKMDNHPYCVCRKTAAEDAKRLSCPLVRDDGGECEIPRRDLQVTQSNLPCLCLYKFYIAYPYLSQPDTSLHRQQENINEQRSSVLEWNVKEEIVTGPALTFSECPC